VAPQLLRPRPARAGSSAAFKPSIPPRVAEHGPLPTPTAADRLDPLGVGSNVNPATTLGCPPRPPRARRGHGRPDQGPFGGSASYRTPWPRRSAWFLYTKYDSYGAAGGRAGGRPPGDVPPLADLANSRPGARPPDGARSSAQSVRERSGQGEQPGSDLLATTTTGGEGGALPTTSKTAPTRTHRPDHDQAGVDSSRTGTSAHHGVYLRKQTSANSVTTSTTRATGRHRNADPVRRFQPHPGRQWPGSRDLRTRPG